ncbi:MAG: RIP metalloprotease RseP [Candidatus Paceibacterota bacterium]
MTIILFLVVLAVLIFVHELGHFLVAKKSGIRVDEFAIGFPPKIFGWTRGETKYVLNLIPFGGYVKIFGENPDDESISGPDSARSFVKAKKWKQISVLLAGIAFNIIFAWLLISISFMFGSLVPVGEGTDGQYSKYIKDSQVVLTGVLKDSPAEKAGLVQGDRLITVENVTNQDLNTTKIRELIEKSADNQIDVSYERSGEIRNIIVEAEMNSAENKKVIGIYMENVGVVKLNPFLALYEGGKLTITTTKEVAVGLAVFIAQAVRGQGDFTQVSGPVGIVGLVGDAATFGLAYFLGFVAFISLNLAVINLIPFPALDGGRVLFAIIEIIIRRPIKPQIANTLNTVGFFILISLMLIITYRDVLKFF